MLTMKATTSRAGASGALSPSTFSSRLVPAGRQGHIPILRSTVRTARTTGSAPRRTSLTTVAKASQSFDANWRALKFGVLDKVEEAKEQFRSTPAVVSAQQWWAKTIMAPVLAVWGVYHAWQTVQLERYREFLGEETKREWAWKRHTENEWAMWKKVVNFVAVLLVSLMWQVLVPVSVVLALVLPMFLSYIVWGNPIVSPVGLSILLISPLKFFPMVNWVWLV